MKHDLHDVCTQIRRDTCGLFTVPALAIPAARCRLSKFMATLYFYRCLYVFFPTGPHAPERGSFLSYRKAMLRRLITVF